STTGKLVPGICPILAPVFGEGFIAGDVREVWEHFFNPPDSPALAYAKELKQTFDILKTRRTNMLTNVATDLNQGGNPNDTRHMANISPLDQENVSCIFARRFQKTVMREFYQLREKEMEKAATELIQDDVREPS
ncbi:MAG: hypothetical protein VYB00_02830, partial [Candidatus Thermoplasmatota archaeon]|nr:hypothetical protein [Candidatus Thermoplasmatota archaeon]